MVDDSMEIASEHGHNTVEEDIDIDIDLTTGHVDEDDILDDIDADAGFDTNIADMPAHIGTDDLMVDDDHDDASYHMEDADLLEEEMDDHNMEQEPTGMTFANDHLSDHTLHDIHPSDSSIVDIGISDQYWDDSQVVQPSDEAVNAQDSEETTHGLESLIDNSVDNPNYSNTKDIQEPAPAPISSPRSPTDKDAQPNSPQNPNHDESHGEGLEHNLNEPTSPNEPIDPNTNIYTEDEEHPDLNTVVDESGSHSNKDAADQEQEHPDQSTASTENSSADPNNVTSKLEDSDGQKHAREIVVKYNNRNYPLIRKSSTDDPNEFFFEETSVVEKPFSEFCFGIRKILTEENLPKDDKISLVIEELQLVIEETQLANYPDNFSLGQIIRLYERLVNNDGTGDIPPLNLKLVIQQTGLDRFLALSKGASEGKGLLDFVTWDADSEDEPTEFGEATELHASESPIGEYDPEPEGLNELPEASDVYDEKSNTELGTDARDEEPQPERHDSPTSASAENPEEKHGEPQEEINFEQPGSAKARQSPEDSQHTNDATDEDGDFIDYEDGEDVENPLNSGALRSELPETKDGRLHNGRSTFFSLPCVLPDICFCPTCNNLVLTECRAAEEESRRNSISLRAENPADELNDQLGEEPGHTDEAAQPNEDAKDVESDIDYEEDDTDKNLGAEEQEPTNEYIDSSERQNAASNGTGNIENAIDLNGSNSEDREYTSFNDDNEIEQTEDGEGFDTEDHILQAPYSDYNETEKNGDARSPDLIDNPLELEIVKAVKDGNLDNGEELNFAEDDFDLGVGDEEVLEFLRDHHFNDDTAHHDNEFLGISVGEDYTTTGSNYDNTVAETDSATLSNASINEPNGTKPDITNGPDQEDEIDYDDDEEGPTSPVVVPQPPTPTSNESPISNSGKRLRADTDFEDSEDLISNEAKRIRS